MKRLLTAAAVLILLVSGCAGKKETVEDKVVLQVNTDGLGRIALAENDAEPEFDEEHPAQSAVMNTTPGSVYTLAAKADDGYMFTKWMKDGSDYSTEPKISVTVDSDVEYIAVFNMSSGYDGPVISELQDAKTIGDILALPNLGSAITESKFIQAFELDGVVYRAIADIDKDLSKALFLLDFMDQDYQDKLNEIIAPLPISRIDNITSQIPTQEEMDKNIGKTGEELLNDGWYSSGYDLENQEIYLNKGFFTYNVSFDKQIDEVGDDENIEDLIKDAKVVSITYNGIGDPTYPESEM